MTNKTITLDRAVAERLRSAIQHGDLFRPEDLKALRAALAEPAIHEHEWDINAEGTATVCHCGARSSDESVPPSGGEPEVLRYMFDWAGCVTTSGPEQWRVEVERELPHPDFFKEGRVRNMVELIDRAHVTRLQAEVERLKLANQRLAGTLEKVVTVAAENKETAETLQVDAEGYRVWGAGMRIQRDALQAELTKARELLHRTLAADTAERHHLPYNVSKLMDDTEAFLQSNQSAPADKGQGEPVAWADPLAFSNFKAHAHRGGPYDHEWMWAKPAHAGMVPLYLHAEQPAPVAVVPDFKMIGTEPMPPMEYDEP